MIIDMVSEHASPLAVLGGADAGGQNVHVAALVSALAALGPEVTVHTRRPFGIVPVEAMACGTRVVASAVGGLGELNGGGEVA